MAGVKTIWLVKRFVNGQASEVEQDQLAIWLDTHTDEEVGDVLALAYEDYLPPDASPETEAALQRVQQRINAYMARESEIPVRSITSRRRSWLPYAAAIALLLAVGSYFFWFTQEKPVITKKDPRPVKNEIVPGGNRATLTLADGRTIDLDEATAGEIAQEGKSRITKLRDGVLTYSSASAADASPNTALATNTLSTPRGGQYRLVLPDGSAVWLNAASAITYPAAFSTNERRVSIKGEAYFEVAKKNIPFVVDVEGGVSVMVLGTKFNVNAYTDEPAIKTTLIEGSVRLQSNKSVLTSLTLEPGQQGQLGNQKLVLANDPDLEAVLAWKNGFFNFNGIKLEEAMRQIARWYDVEVTYAGKIPNLSFGGSIGKNLELSEVLSGLQLMGVHFKVDGKKITVTP